MMFHPYSLQSRFDVFTCFCFSLTYNDCSLAFEEKKKNTDSSSYESCWKHYQDSTHSNLFCNQLSGFEYLSYKNKKNVFLQSLLDEPNPNSPANSQAAQLYQENKREYEKRVTAIVEQSWVDV